jgi:hypothetical protein
MSDQPLSLRNLRLKYTMAIGREPTEAEFNRLASVCSTIGVSDNDALLLVLFGLEKYQAIYDEVPARIRTEVETVINGVRRAAEAEAVAGMQATHHALVKSVQENARKVASAVAGRDRAVWISIALMAALAVFLFQGSILYRLGHNQGRSGALLELRDEKAAAAWGNSPEGRYAQQLAKTGYLAPLIRCNGPGLFRDGDVCRTAPDRAYRVTSWPLPKG